MYIYVCIYVYMYVWMYGCVDVFKGYVLISGEMWQEEDHLSLSPFPLSLTHTHNLNARMDPICVKTFIECGIFFGLGVLWCRCIWQRLVH